MVRLAAGIPGLCIRSVENIARQIFLFCHFAPPLLIDADPSHRHSIPADPLEINREGDKMTRSPRVDSACRFVFPKFAVTFPPDRRGLAQARDRKSGWGLNAILQRCTRAEPCPRDRPSISRPSPRRSTAHRSRPTPQTSNDWPTIGLDYAETRFSKAQQDQRRQRQEISGLVWSYPARIFPRRRGDAGRGRRHHVSDGVMERGCTPSTPAPARNSGATIPGLSTARRATRAAVDVVKSRAFAPLEGQGVCRRL